MRLRTFAIFLVGVTGCASTEHLELEVSRLRKQVRQISGDLNQAQTQLQRLDDRVLLLGARDEGDAVEAVPTAPAVPVVAAQPVRAHASTVQAAPVSDFGAVEDGQAPVLIKIGPGDDGRLPVDRSVLSKPDPVLDESRPAPAPAPAPQRFDKQQMKAEYAEALSLLREQQRPDLARGRFAVFEAKYRSTSLGDNAAYWLGECSFAEGEHARAIDEFLDVVSRYPESNKIPDAYLRVAQSWSALGQSARAQSVFKRIVDRYPKSHVANAARAALEAERGADDKGKTP